MLLLCVCRPDRYIEGVRDERLIVFIAKVSQKSRVDGTVEWGGGRGLYGRHVDGWQVESERDKRKLDDLSKSP